MILKFIICIPVITAYRIVSQSSYAGDGSAPADSGPSLYAQGSLRSYENLDYLANPASEDRSVREVDSFNPDISKQVLLGGQVEFNCALEPLPDITEISFWWEKDGQNISQTDGKYSIQVSKTSDGVVSSSLVVENIDWADSGGYQCRAGDGGSGVNGELALLAVHSKPQNTGREGGSGPVNSTLELSCSFEGYPLPNISWLFQGNPIRENQLKYEITEDHPSNRSVKSLLTIISLAHGDNGTYLCYGENKHNSDTAFVNALVFDVPEVVIDQIIPVSSSKLFLNWTVKAWNLPIQEYFLHYRVEGEKAWEYHRVSEINPESTSFLMSNLTADKSYSIKLAASNEFGSSEFSIYEKQVKTLDFDPVFIPEISIKGITKNSISVGWNDPPEKVAPHIHFYKATKRSGEVTSEVIHSQRYPLHLWSNLESATTYEFTVSACNQFSMECSPPSEMMTGSTYDGKAGPPAEVRMSCRSDNVSNMNWVDVRWQPPLQPNGVIEFYNVELSGRARFKDENGKTTVISTSPKMKTAESGGSERVTRFDFLDANTNYSVRVCAVTGSKECGGWSSDACTMNPRPPLEEDMSRFNWIAEEREGKDMFKLPIPKLSGRNGGICCIRVVMVKLQEGEAISSLPSDQSKIKLTSYNEAHAGPARGAYIAEVISSLYMGRDVFLGDGKNTAALGLGNCPECHPHGRELHKRFTNPTLEKSSTIEDGFLDSKNNYTAFVEVVIEGGGIGRSPYLISRKPGLIGSERIEVNTVLVSVLGVLAGLVLVALLLLVVLYVLRRYSKQVANQQGVEMDLKHTFRHLCSTLRGVGHSQFLLTQENFSTPDMPPIDKSGMVAAYLERHKDSDYGFQSEFESLPESYNDRTTIACDMPCNKSKNRYPDIKSYDQTRVKLSLVEDIEGSDYINANFVVGYKERKKWICTQGPLISTLTDFWRMIHEQGVEIVIMLTNLEEYNRIKCAQYWPGAGTSDFGHITVAFIQERRYSDFVVRELKMSVEGGKSRHIQHYHYLQWKDFNAPEHAPAMIKFVKRINEAWSGSSPILVHCSAGVGRSGTLIAIDSLIQNINDEGSVSIFQTVSDLRRQRNYLVQSVKQYQFVYRAIMEYSQFGDTECLASKLKESWVTLAQDQGTALSQQFNKLAMVVDDRKALSVATNVENRSKNGSDSIIPYDRNRVILTPDGTRPHSTYINASFIEGYHNDESFIITQDPLEETALDFWRMVVEHNVATMVLLSSDGDFWKYWAEDGQTRDFGYIAVTHTSTENRVAYIKREFTVYNKKTFEEVSLTHFHYTEWPGGEEDRVPSSTHGLLGLVEHALAHQEQASLTGPIAVHCRYGSYRSSIYVVLSVLVQQIKKESRCDVFTGVRKLRAQRQGMIQEIAQYEFVYRAISDYVELYMNKEEEYEYSVPVGMLNTGTTKSAKSIQSAKSNGSGPYSVPVGTMKSNGSSGSS